MSLVNASISFSEFLPELVEKVSAAQRLVLQCSRMGLKYKLYNYSYSLFELFYVNYFTENTKELFCWFIGLGNCVWNEYDTT